MRAGEEHYKFWKGESRDWLSSPFWQIFYMENLSLSFSGSVQIFTQAESSETSGIFEYEKQTLEVLGDTVLMRSYFCDIWGSSIFNEVIKYKKYISPIIFSKSPKLY